ncbi:MAG: hypothetical protein U0794_09240 [Isosphaeraceae bacterium]
MPMDQPVEKDPKAQAGKFDFDAFPADTLFYDRRAGRDRRTEPASEAALPSTTPKTPVERRDKKERRRRIDPTTFEKQYTEDELEFMTAMQRFKVQSGKAFPSHGDVLRVAFALGYRKWLDLEDEAVDDMDDSGHSVEHASVRLAGTP